MQLKKKKGQYKVKILTEVRTYNRDKAANAISSRA